MDYNIIYDSPGRLRVRCGRSAFSQMQEQSLTDLLLRLAYVSAADVSSVNGSILVLYKKDYKNEVLSAIQDINSKDLKNRDVSEIKKIDEDFKKQIFRIIKRRFFIKLFVPPLLRSVITFYRALKYIKKGVNGLLNGKLNVDVLDAASITAAIVSGSYGTAASVMTLLDISTLLEGYTKKRVQNALSDGLALNIEKVWRIKDGVPIHIPLKLIQPGDIVRVQSGCMIPIDGSIMTGSAGVNESSMTGEPAVVLKDAGSTVYAGTVIEEGSIDICVTQMPDSSRINRIIELIDTNEGLKAGIQNKAEVLADRLAPFSLITCAATYLLTGSLMKALSVLMVDYSCAIKLSTPICIISAMREATSYEIMIKGGKYLENFAHSDTIVFDKTGTLTSSCPTLSKVIAFGDYTEEYVLRTSACLEEHFPHSVAKAIVRGAEEKNLQHQEEHADVEYIVAHGIASSLYGNRVLIGSAHFVFEDENVRLQPEQSSLIDKLSDNYSLVYLAIGDELAGLLCIEDPIRKDAESVIPGLKKCGFNNIIMMTGDGKGTAGSVCQKLGIPRYYAQVLPENKSELVKKIKSEGHKVVMVGDGINDSPALSAADVSVAMKDASDIAREVADITLLSSELDRLIVLRQLSEKMFSRIYGNYLFITIFNTALLILGIAGIITPSVSALMHNMSTMCICAGSMRRYLKEGN